jgi:hypothetical protein
MMWQVQAPGGAACCYILLAWWCRTHARQPPVVTDVAPAPCTAKQPAMPGSNPTPASKLVVVIAVTRCLSQASPSCPCLPRPPPAQPRAQPSTVPGAADGAADTCTARPGPSAAAAGSCCLVDLWSHGVEHLPHQLRHPGGEQPASTNVTTIVILRNFNTVTCVRLAAAWGRQYGWGLYVGMYVGEDRRMCFHHPVDVFPAYVQAVHDCFVMPSVLWCDPVTEQGRDA